MPVHVPETELRAPAQFEWYLIESSRPDLSTLTHRAAQFGPFASEDECRAVLDSARQIRRFRGSVFEIHKRRERRDQRFQVEYVVRLCHPKTDETLQLARTVDVSVSGACLGNLTARLNPGEEFNLHCADRKAPFQVVWVGSGSAADQAGVRCLSPEVNIWRLDLSELSPELCLSGEIEHARAVQHRLFPQQAPPLRTLAYSGHCTQASTVGGDYYDFLPFKPGEVGFVIADVSGKGIAAALLMANLHGSLRAQCALGESDPVRLLAGVNRHLHQHTETQHYVTAFFAVYDDRTRALRYVNCGHCAPLLLRRTAALERLDPTATVLGLFPDWEGSIAEVCIEPGDLLAMYTDGITEARHTRGEEFGEGRLLSALRLNRHLDPASLVHKLEQMAQDFRSAERHDDLTLIVARGT